MIKKIQAPAKAPLILLKTELKRYFEASIEIIKTLPHVNNTTL